MSILEIKKGGLTFDGKPFYLASGDLHYFRFFESEWEHRLKLAKDFGLTAIQTYVPWDLHEPEEGKFCFGGNLNIKKFLDLCKKYDLKVMFRPSPYMCSEWDFGGLPYWLLNKNGIGIRTREKQYLDCVSTYYKRLAQEFIPYLSTNGGPIIAVAVENEYGSFADDTEYIKYLANLLKELGVDVPMYTANGHDFIHLHRGSNKDLWTAIDTHELYDVAVNNMSEYQPDLPIYIAEFWAGRSQQWGGHFVRQTPERIEEVYDDMLNNGAYVNFYMFSGGTNFGFSNGALVSKYITEPDDTPRHYIPFATSYDVDALISEHGVPSQKYYKCKAILKKYMEKAGFEYTGSDSEDTPIETQAVSEVKFKRGADFLMSLEQVSDNIKKSAFPLNMEVMGQDYGYILYSTHINHTDDYGRMLVIDGLHDRATVYGNGKYLGSYIRDGKNQPIKFYIPRNGMKLDILVENMGRVNFGHAMLNEKKGICGYVKIHILDENEEPFNWDYSAKTSWTNYSLSLKNINKTDYSNPPQENRPCVLEYEFDAKAGVPTFFDMNGWTKGVVFVNGFNVGRYWNVGPQGTLYIPGELIKEHNTMHIFELHKPADKVSLIDEPKLDILSDNVELK